MRIEKIMIAVNGLHFELVFTTKTLSTHSKLQGVEPIIHRFLTETANAIVRLNDDASKLD